MPRGRRRLAEEERCRRFEAFHATANDREAAARVGITQSAFTFWRRHERLPAKGMGERFRFDVDEARRVYEEAPSDRVAAQLLGVRQNTWRRRRGKLGWPAKQPRRLNQ